MPPQPTVTAGTHTHTHLTRIFATTHENGTNGTTRFIAITADLQIGTRTTAARRTVKNLLMLRRSSGRWKTHTQTHTSRILDESGWQPLRRPTCPVRWVRRVGQGPRR